jgi:hypothetical protein
VRARAPETCRHRVEYRGALRGSLGSGTEQLERLGQYGLLQSGRVVAGVARVGPPPGPRVVLAGRQAH